MQETSSVREEWKQTAGYECINFFATILAW